MDIKYNYESHLTRALNCCNLDWGFTVEEYQDTIQDAVLNGYVDDKRLIGELNLAVNSSSYDWILAMQVSGMLHSDHYQRTFDTQQKARDIVLQLLKPWLPKEGDEDKV